MLDKETKDLLLKRANDARSFPERFKACMKNSEQSMSGEDTTLAFWWLSAAVWELGQHVQKTDG